MRNDDGGRRAGEQCFPPPDVPSRMDLFRSNQSGARNQMADALMELKAKQAPAGAAAPIAPTSPH